MKKFFIFISALMLAVTASAVTTTIGPNDSNVTVKNKLSEAVSGASSNDVIELSDGIYEEDGGFYITKNLTIRAAENAHPVIAQKYAILVKNSAQVTFNGIKFDGALYPVWEETKHAADHCIRPYESNGEETLTLINCEFIHYPNYIIYTQRDVRRCDAITIQNCYFHDNTRSAVYITAEGEHQTCNSLTIENTTFADFTGNYPIIYYDAPELEHTTTLNINHCTFYKHPYPAINLQKSSTINITNCIFAQPSSLNRYSIVCQEGTTIDHCLAYNTNGYSGASSTNDLTGNPYFLNTNPADYDFTVWTTSPAHNAGTDGYDLGDYTRWNTDPSTHVATVNITADDDNSLKAAVDAALPGDEIVLATGTYNESESISIDKNITIKAAAEATPTVVPVNSFAISNGAEVTIQNIKFNATSITGNLISVSDATAGNELTLEGCELYNTGSHKAIHAGSSAHLDACSINNCYFHNGNNSAIHIEGGSTSHVCDRIEITNSTFANYSGFGEALIQIASKGGTLADDQEIVVDHCTFYNFTKNASNT